MALLDTSGLTLAPAGTVPDAVTQAALDSMPVTGIAPYNAINLVDTSNVAFSPNMWLIAAAIGVFVLAVAMPGGRR